MIFEETGELETLFANRDIKKIEELTEERSEREPFYGPRRSSLMVSANRIRHLNRLDSLPADVAVINLEDGVAPEEKEAARHMAALFLSKLRQRESAMVVRVNPLDEGGLADMELLGRVAPDAIRIPKVTSVREVHLALERLPPGVDLHLTIETKEAFLAIRELKVDPRVTTLYLGLLDLLVSMGLPHSLIRPENETIRYLLSRFLVESRMSGFHPFSFVFQNYRDLESFAAWCTLEREMGYVSKGCISPDQAKIANRIFLPDMEEIRRARHVVERFEEMRERGSTGFTDETFGFIDEPIYKNAKAILRQFDEEERGETVSRA